MSMKKVLQIIQAQMIEDGKSKYSINRILFHFPEGAGGSKSSFAVVSILKVDDEMVMFESHPDDRDWDSEYIRIMPHDKFFISIKKDDPLLDRIKKSMQDMTPFI